MNKPENQSTDDIRKLLRASDRIVTVDAQSLSKEVVARVANRRTGLRRISVGSAMVFAFAAILIPFLVSPDQKTEVARKTGSNSTAADLPDTTSVFQDKTVEQRFEDLELSLAKQKLHQLRRQLSELDQELQSQSLILAKEKISRDMSRMVFDQIKISYPSLNGG